MKHIIIMLIIFVAAPPLWAETIVSLVSDEQIAITSNFDGAEITVFGSIERDTATVSRTTGYDIAIIAKGPPVDIVTRKKQRTFGIWINRKARIFLSVPSFYALYSNREPGELASPKVLQDNEIGLNNIVFPTVADTAQTTESTQEFMDGYRRLKASNDLFQVKADAVEFLNPTLFKSRIFIPARAPVGDYTVEIYLFQEGALLSKTEQTFRISKVGFEQWVYDLSKNKSLIFGLLVVILAVVTGWVGGVVFRRD